MKSRPIFNGISVGNEEQAEDVIENFKPHKQKGRVSLVKRGTLPLVKPKQSVVFVRSAVKSKQ